jgi:hypothetical protein
MFGKSDRGGNGFVDIGKDTIATGTRCNMFVKRASIPSRHGADFR